MMKQLEDRNYALISGAVQMCGTFDPDEIMSAFVERLYIDEYQDIEDFLRWCHQNDKKFGSGNYEQIFTEFRTQSRCRQCGKDNADHHAQLVSVRLKCCDDCDHRPVQ